MKQETLNKVPEGCTLRKLQERWEVGVVELSVTGYTVRVAGISTLLSAKRGWWNDVAEEANGICITCRLCNRRLESTGTPQSPRLTVIPKP